jgi:hypothetical protein
VGKDLLLGKGTVSFQAINKGTLQGHKEEEVESLVKSEPQSKNSTVGIRGRS